VNEGIGPILNKGLDNYRQHELSMAGAEHCRKVNLQEQDCLLVISS